MIMKYAQEIQFDAENAGIGSCTKNELKDVSFYIYRNKH